MNSEMLYSIFGVISLFVIIYLVLRSDKSKKSYKTKDQKRTEIIDKYKKELAESLKNLVDDKESRISHKKTLLKKYSDELSQNIFFDKDEIREIILKLSTY